MNQKNSKNKSGIKKNKGGPCEMCEFYDYNEESEQFECIASLDQDELAAFVSHNTDSCPYFRFYDEYKSVQKQN